MGWTPLPIGFLSGHPLATPPATTPAFQSKKSKGPRGLVSTWNPSPALQEMIHVQMIPRILWNSLLKWSQAYITDPHRLLPHILCPEGRLCHHCACSEAQGVIGVGVEGCWHGYEQNLNNSNGWGAHIHTRPHGAGVGREVGWTAVRGPGSQLSLHSRFLNLSLIFQALMKVYLIRQ